MQFALNDKLPCSETVMTMDGPKKGCYVIVYNKNNYGPAIRHVLTNTIDCTLAEFCAWYYSEYTILDGDEFVVCETRKQRDKCIQNLREEI